MRPLTRVLEVRVQREAHRAHVDPEAGPAVGWAQATCWLSHGRLPATELSSSTEPTSALDVSVEAAILSTSRRAVQADATKGSTSSSRTISVLCVTSPTALPFSTWEWPRGARAGGRRLRWSAPSLHRGPSSAVPSSTAGGRHRIGRGGHSDAANSPSGRVFHTRCPRRIGAIGDETEPPLIEVEPGHDMRCHIPLSELRALQAAVRDTAKALRRENPGRGLRAPVARTRCRSSTSPRPGRGGGRAPRRERCCHLRLQRDIDGTAETRCPAVLGHEGAGVVEAVGPGVDAGCGRGPCRALLGAVVRCVRRVPARPAAAVLDRLAGDGHAACLDGITRLSLWRRAARLPLLVPLDVRRSVRRARAVVRPHRERGAV